jgi:hypothetical protein
MKNHYLQICILIVVFLSLSHVAKSQEAVSLGNHKDFIDKFKNQTSLTATNNKVNLKISQTESLTGILTVNKKDGNADIFIGGIENESNSTFFLTATPSGIEGNIVLVNKKIAYEYYSDAQGNPFIKPVDIHKVLCIDYNKAGAAAADSGVQYAPAPGSTAYTLQSLPGAPAVALLDFDGQYVPAGSKWNSGNPINAAASSFTDAQVTEMWKMISEDYRPFNINITTDSNVFFAMPANRRQRCIFTPTNTAAPGAGGVAYVNSFSNGSDNDTPCWVFNSGVKSGGEAGSHELGHTFGLSHDGTTDGTATVDEYYLGQGYWAPIMGAAYYDILGQWSKGEYANANNKEDDVAIITKTANGVTYRADEAGNTIATAKVLTIAASGTVTGSQNYGIITTRTDVDVYSFTTSGGTVNITVSPAPLHPDLNVLLTLTDAAGTVLITANPTPTGTTNSAYTASLAASISTTLAAGTYYLSVDGTGEGDPLVTGYTDYACLGEYTISGTIPVTGGSIPPTVSLTAPANNATFCSGTAITLTATATDADGTISKVEFFDGTTLITTLTASPYTYNWTNAATGAHSITVKATDNGNLGTTSTAVSITVNATPAAPIVNAVVNYCQNATATALTATGTALKWYTVATGGTSTTAPTPATTAVGTTNYYVSQTTNSCESARAMISVNVNATPSAPAVTTPVTYCQNATAINLTATGTALKWYTVSTGGTGSTTAPIPSTTTVGTTNRYVSQTISGCESQRATIAVTVNASPAAPTVSTPVSYCQNATATQLSATGTALSWYSTSTGSTGSATAPTPATTTTGTTNYYVSQTTNGCESPRASIAVTVNAIPSAPAATATVNYCQNAAATALTATGTALKWYTVATGGTSSATAPVPSTATAGTVNYYVSQTANGCESARTMIAVTVNIPPPAPTVTSTVTYCQGASASALTATGTALKWYAVATGGTSSATAPTPSTAAAGTISYYVSQTTSGCESPRASIAVTVNAAPAPTVTTPLTYCQNATATALTATGTSLSWYSGSTGGTGSATAPTPSTATAGTINYYVSQTISGCESARSTIAVTVNAIPSSPAVTSPVTYCQNATAAALGATGNSLKWYTTVTGGTGSATAPTPSTTTVGTTNYYTSQTTGGCESARAAIAVTVNAAPSAPAVTGKVNYCQNDLATPLTATGTALQWYTSATGGTGSATAPTPSTVTDGLTNYYVSQTSGGCESARASISVSVNVLPTAAITAGGPTTFTQGGSVILSANTGTGLTYKWFNGAAQVGTNATYTATTGGNYTVEVTNASGCKATSPVTTVTVNGNLPPAVTITSPADNTSLSSPANVTINATASDADGSVSKVEFYNGTTLLGADASSPYSFALNNLPQGTYTLTAVATDNLGATTTSSAITITVTNPLPIVGITAPLNGTNYVANAMVTIDATASDANGSVTLVEFYNGATLLGSDASSPYSFTWSNVTAGTYNITARAVDNEGGAAVSSVITITVTANQPSVITITSPSNNSTVTGTSVSVDVSVTDPDGSITVVEFLDGTTVIGSSTTAPYTFTWNDPAVGTHDITVRVTDSNGGVTVSTPTTIIISAQTGIYSLSGTDVFSKVYPNPTSSGIDIETSISLEKASIRFLNALGSDVFVPFTLSGTDAHADVSSLATGVYTLLIMQNEIIIRKKIVVTR